MTDQEWAECGSPQKMLDWWGGRVSARKLRLLLCAWCRLDWDQFPERSRWAVETAELVADGAATEGARQEAHRNALTAALRTHRSRSHLIHLASSAVSAGDGELWVVAWNYSVRRKPGANCRQCDAIRDIFDPFHNAVDPESLTPTAVALARAAYERRDPRTGRLEHSRLAVLSDALEECGVGDEPLLAHLRSPGPHYPGCFAVDLILQQR